MPFPRVEKIRMNFKYQSVKVCLDVPEFIMSKRSYLQFKNAVSKFCMAQYRCSPSLSPVFFSCFTFLHIGELVIETVEKFIYTLTMLCSVQVDRNDICLYDLHDIDCFRAVDLYKSLHI